MILFAMAGLAEGVVAMEQGILLLSMMASGVAVTIGLLARSRGWSCGPAVWLAGVTALFLPWRGFWPEPTTDSDLQSFQHAALGLAWIWSALSVVGVLGLVRSYVSWERPREGTSEAVVRSDAIDLVLLSASLIGAVAWLVSIEVGRL